MPLPIDPATAAWITRRRKEGFGEGEGADYTPWLTVRSFGSRGVAHRFESREGRVQHLFSTREYHCCLLLTWSERVADVREQYPLHELAETQAIAAELGYRHPVMTRKIQGRAVRREEPMTTDFLVTLADGADGPPFLALSVKPLDDLHASESKVDRIMEKAEIERRFWARRGVPFRMVTDRELPAAMVGNLELALHHRTLRAEEHGLTDAELPHHLDYLYNELGAAPEVALNRVCAATDAQLRLRKGTCLTLVWHAIGSRRWAVDLHTRIDPDAPLRELHRTAWPNGAPTPHPNASTALLQALTAAEEWAA